MTYTELISQFEVFDNPPKKDGYDRHHIVPKSEQTEPDERQIYCSLPMHMWLHILYDREHGTKTAARFLSTCGKPEEFFTCYELCLAYSYTLQKKKEEGIKKLAEVQKTPEYREKMSDSLKGEKNPFYGKHHSGETKKKIAYAQKGEKSYWYDKHHSGETKKKIADARTGIKHTEEARQKMTDAKKGNTYTKGHKWFNDGVKNVMAYECPEGYVPGRIRNPRVT